MLLNTIPEIGECPAALIRNVDVLPSFLLFPKRKQATEERKRERKRKKEVRATATFLAKMSRTANKSGQRII